MNQYPRPIPALKLFERPFCVRIKRRRARLDTRLRDSSSEPFQLTNCHSPTRNTARERHADLVVGNREQRPSMPGRQATLFEQILDRFFQFEKTHGVRNCRAILSGPVRDFFLREMELVRQALKCASLLNRIQILTLQVLNQGHLKRHLFWDVAQNGRYARQLRSLRRTPAALSGDQLIPLTNPPDHQRLHDPTRAD